MGEVMTFPDTWEEFEQLYGFTDTKHIYTNGSRLIHSFRVKQWLDYIEKLPSAERVGHWVEHLDMHPLAKEESKYVCSCCGWRTRQVETNGHLVGGYGAEAIGAEWVCTEWEDLFYKYCPNCGARMVSE